MLTGDIRTRIDAIWDASWSGGISNPVEVIDQITYLLFVRRLDDLHTLEENKARTTKTPMGRRVFPDGADDRGRPYDDLRWSRLKHLAPQEMFAVVADPVLPFLRGKVVGNEAAHKEKFVIPNNMRVPVGSVIFRLFGDGSARDGGGREDTSQWESQGKSQEGRAVAVEARRLADRVIAILQPVEPARAKPKRPEPKSLFD